MDNLTKSKSAIIGKLWANVNSGGIVPANYILEEDMTLAKDEAYIIGKLNFRTDRSLNTSPVEGEITPLTLKKGDTLFFYTNPKREGRTQDPDFSVSVRLPEEQANTIINNSKKGIEAWRKAQGTPIN